jgi:enoyl-CoA hydratase
MITDLKNWLTEIDETTGIITLTINRESDKNSLNVETIQELNRILDVVETDPNIKASIITGAGRIFGIGAHIPEILTSADSEKSLELSHAGQKIFSRLENIGKPSCAAINGIFCLGGSFELALSCTFRVASNKVRIGLPEVSLGVLPGYGGTQRLPKFVGLGKAREMILTGLPIKADEAHNINLVNALCEPGKEVETAAILLKKVLMNAPLSIKAASNAINKSYDLTFEEGLKLEALSFSKLRGTEDAAEGLSANQERRKAKFNSK